MYLYDIAKVVDPNRKLRNYMHRSKILYTAYQKLYYEQIIKKKRRMVQEKGFEVLTMIHETLGVLDIRFFVDFGTLLGIVRDNRLIEHDLDIDIGVILDDGCTVERVREQLTRNGCSLWAEYVYRGVVAEQSYFYRKVKFDICFYAEDSQHSYCHLFYRDPDNRLQYDENTMSVVQMKYTRIKGIEQREINGVKLNIPQEAQRLLEEKYGVDWRVPNSDWVYWKSPAAVPCDGLGHMRTYH